MLESKYQCKIIKSLEQSGGYAINGMYSKKGEADIIGGFSDNNTLYFIAIEVKTEKAYNKLMKGVEVDKRDRYVITDMSKLDKREVLQLTKINQIRGKGGLALFAHSWEQVLNYCMKILDDTL